MGEENQNGTETAALFVSAQKKKQAEEEAARKAAEEQAKREAAEAEVRRMEAEIENQKKKAEEERLALEQAQREEALRAKQLSNQQSIRDIKEAAGNKKGVFIGIGAAAGVLLVILLLVTLITGKGKKVNFEKLEADDTYRVAEAGYEMDLLYPDDLYPEVAEKVVDEDHLQILFQPKNKKTVRTEYFITTPKSSTGKYTYTRDNVILYGPADKQKALTEGAKAGLEVIAPGATLSDEVSSEYSDSDPGKFYYTFSFTAEGVGSGAGASWIEPASDDLYKVVSLYCLKEAEDTETVTKLRDLLYEKNAEDAFLMPGAAAPESTELNGMLKEDTMHLGIPVPKDMFVRYGVTTNYSLWTDINGGMVIAYASPTDIDFSDSSAALDYEGIYEALEEVADTGLKTYFPEGLTERTELSRQRLSEGEFGVLGEYRSLLDGVTYYEKYRIAYWTDLQTGKHYFATIIMLCPEKNGDAYKPFFEKAMSSLADI